MTKKKTEYKPEVKKKLMNALAELGAITKDQLIYKIEHKEPTQEERDAEKDLYVVNWCFNHYDDKAIQADALIHVIECEEEFNNKKQVELKKQARWERSIGREMADYFKKRSQEMTADNNLKISEKELKYTEKSNRNAKGKLEYQMISQKEWDDMGV